MSVWKEIQSSFKNGSTLTKLIYLNLAIFLFITLISIFDTLFRLGNVSGFLVTWMAVPSTIERLIIQPWSIITYMFLHEGFFHILFNILWLYWFGKLFLQYLDQKKLVGLYILGGISGALLYLFLIIFFPGSAGIHFYLVLLLLLWPL
ncbi:MAG: rhomboid family intramembrane serine protease [bacterium]